MAFLNGRVSAVEAENRGLVTRVVADDAVDSEALTLARQIAAGPTHALAATKRLLGQAYATGFDAQLDTEGRAIGNARRTRDAWRKPFWRGKSPPSLASELPGRGSGCGPTTPFIGLHIINTLIIARSAMQNIGFYFSDIARLLRKRFDASAKRDGLTSAQWRVLMSVAKQPGLNQGQLAEQLEVEPITVCRMIDRMEQAGLVDRKPDPLDRRARLLFPATNADVLIEQLNDHGQHLLDAMTSALAPEDLDTLLGLLEQIRTNLLDDSLFAIPEPANG